MLVYISGKMSGLSVEDYRSLFLAAEQKLLQLGYSVVNPSTEAYYTENGFESKSYGDILLKDLEILNGCDAICMLDNWQQSKGAKTEHAFAVACHKKVIKL